MKYYGWKTAARRVVAWRHATDQERARVGVQILVSFDCGHDTWLHPSSLYWRNRARPKLHCIECEERCRSQLELFRPTRWPA